MEDEFTSGPWTGFYTYVTNVRDPMSLFLSFREGRVTGSGSDPVGDFVIRGQYTPESNEIHWTKAYVGRHQVFYRGFRDARGIWGTWEIPGDGTGGFHIWPEGHGAGAAESAEAEEDVPAGVGIRTPLAERR